MRGYPDLVILAGLPVQLFLVTSGFRRLQESKVRSLGIEHLFAEIHIDAIDEPDRKGKRRIFESILDRNGLRADEVLVVGDNADSEIEAGNRLGITTVQVLRPGVPRSSKARITSTVSWSWGRSWCARSGWARHHLRFPDLRCSRHRIGLPSLLAGGRNAARRRVPFWLGR
jgi:beta-phosphoglucomutase-like phosphatase (HAD superfamily)